MSAGSRWRTLRTGSPGCNTSPAAFIFTRPAWKAFPACTRAFPRIEPDELYHLAAQSFVSYSFQDAFSTFDSNIHGTHYVLESVRQCVPRCRVYFAGSSEMFGKADEAPQSETTKFQPRSPYGISKVTGFHLAQNYRDAYGLFVCSGILFNHESPRRGFEFVSRKITSYAAKIKAGLETKLPLGNLEARRDWGFAKEYVLAMYLMMQQSQPDDFVVATGTTHSVREFCELAFGRVGLDYHEHVVIEEELFRPSDVHLLQGNAVKAKAVLGWEPTVGFQQLVEMMVDHDLAHAAGGA